MKNQQLAVVLPLLCGIAMMEAGTAAQASEGVPALIPSPPTSADKQLAPALALREESQPLWVSAEALQAGSEDSLRWDLLPSNYRERYQSETRRRQADIASAWESGDASRAKALARCPKVPTKFFRSGQGRHNRNLDDLATHAVAVYRGTVRDRASGFVLGRVASLLEIEVDQALKAEPRHPELSRLLIEYPYADFTLPGDHLFCLRPDRRPAAPAPGDSVIFFLLFPPQGAENLVLDSRSEEVIFESAGTGALSLPKTLREDARFHGIESLDQVGDLLVRLLESPK